MFFPLPTWIIFMCPSHSTLYTNLNIVSCCFSFSVSSSTLHHSATLKATPGAAHWNLVDAEDSVSLALAGKQPIKSRVLTGSCNRGRSDHISCSVVSNSLRSHESQHARPPCPSPTPRVHSDSCPSSQWCHLAISSSVVPFSSCPQSLPASESFPMSQLFAWGDQSTGVSALASFLPK